MLFYPLVLFSIPLLFSVVFSLYPISFRIYTLSYIVLTNCFNISYTDNSNFDLSFTYSVIWLLIKCLFSFVIVWFHLILYLLLSRILIITVMSNVKRWIDLLLIFLTLLTFCPLHLLLFLFSLIYSIISFKNEFELIIFLSFISTNLYSLTFVIFPTLNEKSYWRVASFQLIFFLTDWFHCLFCPIYLFIEYINNLFPIHHQLYIIKFNKFSSLLWFSTLDFII